MVIKMPMNYDQALAKAGEIVNVLAHSHPEYKVTILNTIEAPGD